MESVDRNTDLYELLGVAPEAHFDEIKSAYRAMVRRTHPDSNGGNGHTELFKRIRQAYETLSDPQARSAYDFMMGFAATEHRGSFYDFRFEDFFDRLFNCLKMEWWKERIGRAQQEPE